MKVVLDIFEGFEKRYAIQYCDASDIPRPN